MYDYCITPLLIDSSRSTYSGIQRPSCEDIRLPSCEDIQRPSCEDLQRPSWLLWEPIAEGNTCCRLHVRGTRASRLHRALRDRRGKQQGVPCAVCDLFKQAISVLGTKQVFLCNYITATFCNIHGNSVLSLVFASFIQTHNYYLKKNLSNILTSINNYDQIRSSGMHKIFLHS